MNRITAYFLICCGIFLFVSCDWEDPIEEQVFLVGKSESNVTQFEYSPSIHIVATQNHQITQPLDIDNDGEADVSIICKYAINSQYYHQKSVTLKVLNNQFSFSVKNMYDTVFQYVVGTSTVYRKVFNCLTNTNIDHSLTSILSTSTYFTPKMFEYGEGLSKNELWSSESSILAFTEVANYTVGTEAVDHDLIKGLWKNQGEKYLVFKYTGGSEIRYGWIRLQITDYSDVTLYEQAFQLE